MNRAVKIMVLPVALLVLAIGLATCQRHEARADSFSGGGSGSGGSSGIPVPTPPTAGTLTMSANLGPLVYYRFDWSNAQISALSGTDNRIKICSLPSGTIVKDAGLFVTGLAGGVSSLGGYVGYNATSYNQIVADSLGNNLSNDTIDDNVYVGNTTTNNRGSALSAGSLGAYPAFVVPQFGSTENIYLRVVSTGGNLSAVTGSTGYVLLGLIMPVSQ